MALTKITGDVIATNTSITAVGATFTGNVSVAGTITYEDVTDIDSVGLITARSGVNITGGGLIVTGISTVSAGSTSAPSISPSGDSNTGIFFPSADTIAFGEGGSETARIDSNGRFGLGTSSATNTLHVVGSADSVARLSATSDTNLTFSETTANKHWNLKPSAGDFYIQYSGTAYNSGYSNLVTITSAGRLGLGDSAPDARLTVKSSGAASTPLNVKNSGGTEIFRVYQTAGGGSQTSFKDASGNTSIFIDGGAGQVGIGTTSPGQALDVTGTIHFSTNLLSGTTSNLGYSGKILNIKSGQGYGGINVSDTEMRVFSTWDTTAIPITFYQGGSEKARIDSSGRLLVGTSSAFDQSSGLQINGGATGYSANFYTFGADNGIIAIGSARGTVGSPTTLSSADTIGTIQFRGHDGTSFKTGASIVAAIDGITPGSDLPSRLVFSTTADGASSPTERMRINQLGVLKASNDGTYGNSTGPYHEFVSSYSDEWAFRVWHRGNAAQQYGILVRTTTDQNDATRAFLYCEGATTQRAVIRSNGGLANYSANNVNLSDINSKKDITPADDTWDCLKEWEIVNFRYKDQPDDADLNMGVIAQQVAESCPEVITVFQEAKEATETEPAQEERLGVKDQQMMWMAIKALQEAQLRIEQLESINTTLLSENTSIKARLDAAGL